MAQLVACTVVSAVIGWLSASTALALPQAGPMDSAGIRPDRAYYGYRRAMPMTADLGPPAGNDPVNGAGEAMPAGPNESGPSAPPASMTTGTVPDDSPKINAEAALAAATIVLYESSAGVGMDTPWREVARASLKPMWAEPAVRGHQGSALVKFDFNELFPALWTATEPRVMLAQLEISGVPRGSPLMIQPSMTPVYAARTDRSGLPIFVEPEERRKSYSGVRVWTAKQVVVETTLGAMEFALLPEHAPNTVWEFMELIRNGFYTDVPFHRIASLLGRAEPDIVQGGDPLGTGLGGPGFTIDLEPSKLPHSFGVLSMARATDPNSNGSQFFICLNRDGTRSLDGRYTSFGRLVRGQDVLLAIAKSPVGTDERPLNPPMIRRMWLTDTGPKGSEAPPAKDPFEGNGGR